MKGLVYLEVSPKIQLNDKALGCTALGKTRSMIDLLCSVLTVMGYVFRTFSVQTVVGYIFRTFSVQTVVGYIFRTFSVQTVVGYIFRTFCANSDGLHFPNIFCANSDGLRFPNIFCANSDWLHFPNIFCANKFAALYSCFFRLITETVPVTKCHKHLRLEGRMLGGRVPEACTLTMYSCSALSRACSQWNEI